MTKTELFNRGHTITEFNAKYRKFAIEIHQFRLKMSEFGYILHVKLKYSIIQSQNRYETIGYSSIVCDKEQIENSLALK